MEENFEQNAEVLEEKVPHYYTELNFWVAESSNNKGARLAGQRFVREWRP